MAVLTEAAFLALALDCASTVAPDTMLPIARVESAFNTLAIHDNTAKRSFAPETEQDAVTIATNLIVAQGHSVDLGLMQINSANLPRLSMSIPEAFDACKSIKAGARVLSEAYQSALRAALSVYNTGDRQRGFANGYVARIEQAASRVPSLATAAQPPLPAAQPPAPQPKKWDVQTKSGGPQFVFKNKER